MYSHPRALFLVFGIGLLVWVCTFTHTSYPILGVFFVLGIIFFSLERSRQVASIIVCLTSAILFWSWIAQSAYNTHIREYELIRSLTHDFQSGAVNITWEVKKEVFRNDRSQTYLLKITNFDNFDNFDTLSPWLTKWGFPSWEKEDPYIFVEIPVNLSLWVGEEISFRGKIREVLQFPLVGYDRFAFFSKGYGSVFVPTFSRWEKKEHAALANIRSAAIKLIHKHFPLDVAGTILGMTIGSVELLWDETKHAFTQSGISHILVVSGSNIAFLIVLVSFFLKYIPLPTRIVQVLVVGSILFYGTLVSWDISVIRAAIMGTLSYMIATWGKRVSTKAGLILALILLTIVSPLAPLYDAGFGLSFSATLGILLFEPRVSEYCSRIGIPKYIEEILAVSIGAMIGSLPILIYHFEAIAPLWLIANFLIAPVVGWILFTTTAFLGIASISSLLGYYFGYLIYIPTRYLLWVSDIFGHFESYRIPSQVALFISVFFLGMFIVWFLAPEIRFKKA